MHRRFVVPALELLLLGSALPVAHAQGVTAAPERTTRDSARALAPVVSRAQRTTTTAYTTAGPSAALRTGTPLRETPQSVTVIARALIADQAMQGMADVIRYVPGVSMGQGEGNRDQPTIRGNATSADFFLDGIRDDAQYYRDLYNVARVETLKGANAMAFGRGGGGGVINRVTKEAQWSPVRELVLEGGSYDHRRATFDAGDARSAFAARLNGMYERSGAFRDGVGLRRYGVNPTVAWVAPDGTVLRAGVERFRDDRVVDRGIPSYAGGPSPTAITTFFGNRDSSRAYADVSDASLLLERTTGSLTLRNRARWAHYDKFYQNVFPRAVNDDASLVTLGAYNHATRRANLFNQADAILHLGRSAVRHTLLVGGEVGGQATDNVRATGYFDDGSTARSVPFAAPTVTVPVEFRPSATDANSHIVVNTAAAYAQHELALGAHLRTILGLRYDRFAIHFHDNRGGSDLQRNDRFLSPRAGVVVIPVEPLSLYASYGVSYLPASGDQFLTLTATTQGLEPEQFRNREVGAKWELAHRLTIDAALYRLDRTNSQAPDPNTPGQVVQTGAQRTTGWELGVTGDVVSGWQVAGGFASQLATVVSRTTSAQPGARVPLVPRASASLWNRVRLTRRVALGLGVVRQAATFAAIDNRVTLPAFTRIDAAAFVRLTSALRAQVNVENAMNARYYPTSQGNDNIMPGAPRTLRLSLATSM